MDESLDNANRRIFIDLDGTLLDVSKRSYKVYKEIVKELRGTALSKNDYWLLKKNKSSIEKLLKFSNLSKKLSKTYEKEFLTRIELIENLALDILIKHSDKTLRTLHKENDLYLISLRKNRKGATDQLAKIGLKKYFKFLLIGSSKNKTNKFRTKIKNSFDIVIGDTEADILAAKELGIVSIAVLSGIRTKKILKNLKPDFIVKNINHVPKILKKQTFDV